MAVGVRTLVGSKVWLLTGVPLGCPNTMTSPARSLSSYPPVTVLRVRSSYPGGAVKPPPDFGRNSTWSPSADVISIDVGEDRLPSTSTCTHSDVGPLTGRLGVQPGPNGELKLAPRSREL